MATFVVISGAGDPAVKEAIAKEFPDHRAFGVNAWFFPASGTAKEIARRLGVVKGSSFRSVVIVRVDADYNGLAPSDFWHWLTETFEKSSDV